MEKIIEALTPIFKQELQKLNFTLDAPKITVAPVVDLVQSDPATQPAQTA